MGLFFSKMFNQAINLKYAISMASKKLTPIGRCYLDEVEFYEDNHAAPYPWYGSGSGSGSESESDDFDEWNDHLDGVQEKDIELWRKIKESLKKLICPEVYKFGDIGINNSTIDINIGDFNYTGPLKLSQKTLEDLYEAADIATFGNLETMTTDIDNSVRSGKHVPQSCFKIKDDIIEKLQKEWELNMLPCNVKIVPYKINLYGKGGHFSRHCDTPDLNLVGTILLSISSSYTGSKLILDREYRWNSDYAGRYCAFYPDVEHEVTPNDGDAIRATVAFKVYGINGDNEFSIESFILEKFKNITKDLQTPIGLVLNHKYSLKTTFSKGRDNILIKLLTEIGHKVDRLPVCVTHYGQDPDGDEVKHVEISVYPLTDQSIEYILGEIKEEPIILDKKIPFILLGKGFEYHDKGQSYIEHTGNECQPEIVDSLYLHHAIIIQ